MRLMLGYNYRGDGRASLLVEVDEKLYRENPKNFKFYVVNGCWYGDFEYGKVVAYYGERRNSVASVARGYFVMSEEQDRLRGDYQCDYQCVFNNFHDPTYVAPLPQKINYSEFWDDDIPF
jgi:hypothetical protein